MVILYGVSLVHSFYFLHVDVHSFSYWGSSKIVNYQDLLLSFA